MAYEHLRGRQFSPATLSGDLDVSRSQIHRWISSGEIAAVKVSYRCTRIDGDSVADFLTRRQAVPRAAVGFAKASKKRSDGARSGSGYQSGFVDLTLAGLVAFGTVCVALLVVG